MLICNKIIIEMELYEGLLTRRSNRKYTGERIAEERIIKIIRAGMYFGEASHAISNLLDFLSHVHPVSLISIGVPVFIPLELPDRFDPEKIKKNKW
jgi:hypothetical protein